MLRYNHILHALLLVSVVILADVSYKLYRYPNAAAIRSSRDTRLPLSATKLRRLAARFNVSRVLEPEPPVRNYTQALAAVASPDRVVLLALIDGGFLAMAVNFYITCLATHEIDNYLLLATDKQTCERVAAIGMNCHVYRVDRDAGKASIYNSTAFLRKMNIRTDMILEALNADYTVLHTDIDMFFSSNPFSDLRCPASECDMAALQDTSSYNAGFLFVNPTEASKAVYRRMQMIARRLPRVDDQRQLNMAIRELKKKYPDFHALQLDKKKYLCGKYYYEDAKRYFGDTATPCDQCVVIHNNWIVSMEAKVYRAKEMHQWMYDDQEYYSSLSRRYLIYDNPLVSNNKNLTIHEHELAALKAVLAMGRILNRTVVLPVFHCSGTKPCPLNSIIRIRSFDSVFAAQYREHTFLSHPLVPSSVRNSVLGPFLITSKYVTQHVESSVTANVTRIVPKNAERGIDEAEVMLHFGNVTQSVLSLQAAYDVFANFGDQQKQERFTKDAKKAFVKGGYRQY